MTRVNRSSTSPRKKPAMTELEAVRKFPMHYSPPDRRCVICRDKANDFRFGVCIRCAK
jgi:hypothetical protein